ncbi:MAG: choice-of-anchor D domain-containing protein, partial [Candidatus Kapabacteria bacterium]|nr:choice-of-anchor D domain-containing protein [Candidatus Kapabacteria bacterium]
RRLEVTFLRTNTRIVTGYTAPENSVARIQRPGLVYFGNPDPNMRVQQDIVVRPLVAPLDVRSVEVRPTMYYQVVGTAPAVPAVIPRGQDLRVTVEFRQGSARAYRQATLVINGEPCGPQIPLVGGPGRVILLQPNGGDTVSVCDTVRIFWAGVDPTQPVDLAYSTDEGRTWRSLATGIQGLSYTWAPPAPGRYRIRVSAPAQTFWAWAFPIGGRASDRVSGVAVSPDGSCLYVVGAFEDTLRWGNQMLVSRGGKDAFVARLDGEGALVWLFHIGGTHSDEATGVVVDANCNAYVTGWYESPQCYIGTTQFLSLGNTLDTTNAFLVAFDGSAPTPVYRWMYRIGGTWDNSGRVFADRVALRNDTIFVEGRFRRRAYFGVAPGGATVQLQSPSPNFYSTFTGWYRANNQVLGAMVGTFAPRPSYGGITAQDSYGNTYEGGEFSGSRTFGTIRIQSAGGTDGFMSKRAYVPATSDTSDTSFVVAAPRLRLPAELVYIGATPVGTSVDSSLGSVLCNIGNYPVTIVRTSFVGSNPSDFSLVQTLQGRVLKPGECAGVEVRFTPQAVGRREATLVVEGDCGEPTSLQVWGIGYPPCEVTVTDAVFSRTAIGAVRQQSVCVLRNVSGARSISGTVRLAGPDAADFIVTPLGGFMLAPGECLTVQIEFRPSRPGLRRAWLEFDLGAECQVRTARLQGEAAVAIPRVGSVDWGQRRLLTQNPATVDVRNDDSIPARLVRIQLVGPDAASFGMQPLAVPRDLRPTEVLSIPVEFRPQQEGPLAAWVEVEVEGGSETARGKLQGVGILPKIAAEGYRFMPVPVGQLSGEQGRIRIRNVDSMAPLYIAEVQYISGQAEFPPDVAALRAAQGRTLSVGGELHIPVGFQPQAAGRRVARVVILSDAAPGPEPSPRVADTVELMGDGVGVTVTPTTVDFGKVLTCSLRDTTLTLVNGSATAPLRVTAYRFAGDATVFEITPQPPFEVPAGGTQELRVRFSPLEARPYALTVRMENEQGVPVEFSLRGEGEVRSLLIGDGTVVDRVLPGTEVTVPLALRAEPQITEVITSTNRMELCLRVRYAPDFLQFRRLRVLEEHPSWTWRVQPIADGEIELRGQGGMGPNVPPMKLVLDFLVYLALPAERLLQVELCPGATIPRCLVPVVRSPGVRLADVCFLNGRQVRLTGEIGAVQIEPHPVHRGVPIRVALWLPKALPVELEVFTTLGDRVLHLWREELPAGSHELWLPTQSLGGGVYFYRLRIGSSVRSGSFVLLP